MHLEQQVMRRSLKKNVRDCSIACTQLQQNNCATYNKVQYSIQTQLQQNNRTTYNKVQYSIHTQLQQNNRTTYNKVQYSIHTATAEQPHYI